MTQNIETSTRNWVERIVINLNLCPFAEREWVANKVRVQVCPAQAEQELLQALEVELELMSRMPEIETTLLVHPNVLTDFFDYNQFLDLSDALLEQMQFDGVFQIASFHPHYQFADTQPDDVENYTNRSPYPILHILREASLVKAIGTHPDTAAIPDMNIQCLRDLGVKHMQDLFNGCIK